MSNNHNITAEIKSIVLSSGFDLVGVSKAKRLDDDMYLRNWIDNNYQAEMTYMENISKRSDIREINASFKSIITCGIMKWCVSQEIFEIHNVNFMHKIFFQQDMRTF